MHDPNYIVELANYIRQAVADQPRFTPEMDDLFLLYAVLALAKGEAVTSEDVHNAWVAWALEHGRIGPDLVPLHQLSADEQAKDEPFVQAIHQAIMRRAT